MQASQTEMHLGARQSNTGKWSYRHMTLWGNWRVPLKTRQFTLDGPWLITTFLQARSSDSSRSPGSRTQELCSLNLVLLLTCPGFIWWSSYCAKPLSLCLEVDSSRYSLRTLPVLGFYATTFPNIKHETKVALKLVSLNQKMKIPPNSHSPDILIQQACLHVNGKR